jgi:hypothetical protein
MDSICSNDQISLVSLSVLESNYSLILVYFSYCALKDQFGGFPWALGAQSKMLKFIVEVNPVGKKPRLGAFKSVLKFPFSFSKASKT